MKKLSFKKPAAGAQLGKLTPRLLITAAIVVLIAIGGYFGLSTLLSSRTDNTQNVTTSPYEAAAKALAHSIANTIATYDNALAELATRNDVIGALETGDSAALDALASSIAPPLEGVLRLRVLPADAREPDLESKPPLSYGSVSMMNKARETGTEAPAEVHMTTTPDEHLVVLKRVVRPASVEGAPPELLGFLHLSIKVDVLRAILAASAQDDAYVELREGPGVMVASTGRKPTGEPAVSLANVEGSRLAIVFSAAAEAPAPAGVAQVNLVLPIVGLFALLGLGAGGYVFLTRRGVGRGSVVLADTVIFQGAIKNILDGAHPGLEQLLPGMRRSDTVLGDDSFGLRASDEDTTTFNPAGGRVKSEDPTIPGRDTVAPRATEEDFLDIGVVEIEPSIFRTYDIRGIVGEGLTEESVYLIGRALGAEAEARGQKTVVVARDGRHSSEGFLQALANGLLESGRDVLDIGLAPTPVLYFATHYLDAHSGVMITGSHNPSQYNGLKIVLDGETLSGDAIQAIRRRVMEHDFIDGTGSMQSADIVAEYIRRISEEIPVSLGDALKVVVDCGNGVPGMVAPAILRAIGHDVVELFCDVDGDFPNHHPDPSQPENLVALIAAVADEGADLGLAFDGDGDRLGVVDNEGNIIWPDRQMMLFARDILGRNPGAKIIYDVKCSHLLGKEILACGGEPIMTRTGHSLIKARMQETGALLAGEMSGHIFFKERWYGFDDALYSAARLLEILVNSSQTPSQVFAALPGGIATPELRLDMPEEDHAHFMEQVLAAAAFPDAEITTIDGLRVDFSDSWGLVRPSNTTPCLVLRFEGDDQAALDGIKARFRALLLGIDATLTLPF